MTLSTFRRARYTPRRMQRASASAENSLGTEPIGRLLFQMAVPATIAMGVNALYNLVDTIFVGRIVGPLGIGGIGIAFPMQIAVLAVALLVGIGSASTISRSLGAGNPEKAAQVLGNAIIMILLAVAVVAITGLLFLDGLLSVLGATEDLRPYAREYLTVILPGSPFIAMAIVANHLVRSEGRSRRAMTIMLLGAGLNLLLDPLFIYVLDMGVRGAAIATVISQAASFVYAMTFYVSGGSSIKVGLRYIRFDVGVSREVAAVGLASFVRQIAQSLFILITNNVLREVGTEIAISAFGVINKLLIFSIMPLVGIAQGFQPIAGYNYGAGNMRRVRDAVKIANVTVVSIALVYFTVVMLFPADRFWNLYHRSGAPRYRRNGAAHHFAGDRPGWAAACWSGVFPVSRHGRTRSGAGTVATGDPSDSACVGASALFWRSWGVVGVSDR